MFSEIIGPDTFRVNQNNNAYTNVLAANNLFFAEFAACFCKTPNHTAESYYKLARSIALPYLPVTDFTPAFDGHLLNKNTRNAETILLRYPLNYHLNETTHRTNLQLYANDLYPIDLPSTTLAVQNIIRLSLNEIPTVEKFTETFEPYVRGDFKQWSYLVDDEVVVRNHVAGAGGFLQQIINGYAGIKLQDDGLVVEKSSVPPGATSLILNGKAQ